MTQKRKAELQRKLSMAPVAKPPSGLAERIKADIPEYLRPERERDRFSQSWAFTLRVAASIILLVTSVFLTMQLISRDGDVLRVDTPERGPMKSVAEVPPPPPPAAVMPTVGTTTLAATSPAELPSAAEPQAIASAAVRQEAKEERRARPLIAQPEGKAAQKAEAGAPPSTQHPASSTEHLPSAQIGNVSGGVVETRDSAAVAERIVVTAEAPAAPPRPAAVPPPADFVAEGQADTALATSQSASARTPVSVARLQRSVVASRPFGISTDPSVVSKLKERMERGDPPPKQIDVAAVVNHFAGAPANVDDVRLQVEASQAPLKADGTAVIRYTIDTPATLASAEVSIVLEKGVIATYRTIAGPRSLDTATGSLRAGQSATGLVELKLEPGTPEGQRVATVILKYTSPSTKRPVRVATDIRAESLNLTWAAASRRHRLATLSAAWGESLSSAQVVDELILTAARLAKEAPADPLAQELATVTASSRPRSSGPTGSGG
ncbi:MAG TPA: hypothetical protein VFM36_06850 [Thermoanaerobaculia bacterium]|nr:hypothetical protein [Thermoanaerobaculia bacterium]